MAANLLIYYQEGDNQVRVALDWVPPAMPARNAHHTLLTRGT